MLVALSKLFSLKFCCEFYTFEDTICIDLYSLYFSCHQHYWRTEARLWIQCVDKTRLWRHRLWKPKQVGEKLSCNQQKALCPIHTGKFTLTSFSHQAWCQDSPVCMHTKFSLIRLVGTLAPQLSNKWNLTSGPVHTWASFLWWEKLVKENLVSHLHLGLWFYYFIVYTV